MWRDVSHALSSLQQQLTSDPDARQPRISPPLTDCPIAQICVPGCPQWADVFNQFPSAIPLGGLWTQTDLAMASTSMMVVAANANDGAANVNGYYLVRPLSRR
jgi:hypothetical protein